MGDFPRAQILSPRQPVKLSARQRREPPIHIVPAPPLRSRSWSEAIVKVLFVMGILAVLGLLYIGVKFGVLPGEFVK